MIDSPDKNEVRDWRKIAQKTRQFRLLAVEQTANCLNGFFA
jgi:hypothetical protein